MELEHDLARIQAQGFGLVGISYDSVAILKSFADRRGITFPLLSDPDSKLIRAFGILNGTTQAGTPFFGIPYPGTYLVNRKGVVLAKYFVDDFRERDTAAEILVKQFGIQVEEAHSASQTDYFQVGASASNELVHQGQHISLVLDLDLKPKTHVYAPEVTGGYIPIDWKVEESPGFKAPGAISYPKARLINLPVIHETLPVYTGHVHLVRDLVLGTDVQVKPLLTATGELTVAGSLQYQVCDDRECYPPGVLPLKWVLKYEVLDRQRAPAELQRKSQPAVQ